MQGGLATPRAHRPPPQAPNPIRPQWSSVDAAKFGFKRWNYPDAGANQSLSEAGGSPAFNDQRFMESTGPVETGQEGVYQYLREAAAKGKPFFLVISLVNPHDVLFYPLQWNASGYSSSLLQGPASLPTTWNENLITKPAVQRQWAAQNLAGGVSPQDQVQAVNYLNLYANLIQQTDAYLAATLNLMDELGLTDNTVVGAL